MATLGSLLATVHDALHSYTAIQENLTALRAGVDADDTSIPVVGASSSITRGLIEIDDELMWVQSEADGALQVPSFGRGFRGTTAATHSSGAMVTIDPLFPRKNVRQALITAAAAVYPDVYAIKKTTFTFTPVQSTYELPAACERVLGVSWDAIGPTQEWPSLRRWDFVPDANTTGFSTGKAITLREPVEPGRTVQVVYAAPFTALAADSDSLTDAGFTESQYDVLVLGACWRLLQFLEPSRLSLTSAEAQSRGQFSPAGAATNAARQVYALYQQRLAEEKARLTRLHPATVRMTR